MIATIHLPLWTLAAAFCVLCLIPDVIGWVRALVEVSEREPRVRPVADAVVAFRAIRAKYRKTAQAVDRTLEGEQG